MVVAKFVMRRSSANILLDGGADFLEVFITDIVDDLRPFVEDGIDQTTRTPFENAAGLLVGDRPIVIGQRRSARPRW